MKKILITSGGTIEHIDEVRVLTNISTGKLGSTIADTFMENFLSENFDCEIHFVHVKGSELPKFNKFICEKRITYYEVTNVQSVYDVMEKLVPEMNIVIHPMAVSDFGFKPISTKLKSNDPDAFIQSIKDRIYQTPKILSMIKIWNPKCYLVSFKFENGLENDKLIKIATDSMLNNNCDLVIANDKAEMEKLGEHMSYFIRIDNRIDNQSIVIQPVKGKKEIAIEIYNKIKEIC
jgi:phosphopantothenate-cysteine ligase